LFRVIESRLRHPIVASQALGHTSIAITSAPARQSLPIFDRLPPTRWIGCCHDAAKEPDTVRGGLARRGTSRCPGTASTRDRYRAVAERIGTEIVLMITDLETGDIVEVRGDCVTLPATGTVHSVARLRKPRMVAGVSRRRIWAPFVIAFLAGIIVISLEQPIGKFLGLYNPLMGYAAVDFWAGLPIGLVAAAASRTWRGLLTLVLGFAAAGEAFFTVAALLGSGISVSMIVVVGPYVALLMGFLGVPTYAIVVGAAHVIGRLLRPTSPEGIGRVEPDQRVG
jgi:hypothetical protein